MIMCMCIDFLANEEKKNETAVRYLIGLYGGSFMKFDHSSSVQLRMSHC